MEVFSTLIWEKIFERLNYSKASVNLVRAFPELDWLCQDNNKAVWIFDEVLPHLVSNFVTKLIKYKPEKYSTVSQEELLKLRLVCKHWKTAVDLVLTNYSKFYQIENFKLGRSLFRTSEQVEKFKNDMGQFNGNPFPGQSVVLKPIKPLYLISNQLVKSSVEIFEKFGTNIISLEINIRDNFSCCHLELCKNMPKCLHYLPYLRSLSLTGSLDSSAHRNTNIFFENPDSQFLFPDLSNLNTFKCIVKFYQNDKSNWLNRLVKTYTKGVAKASLTLSSQFELTRYLSDLTELKLLLSGNKIYPLINISDFLTAICHNNKVRKITLTSMDYECDYIDILKLISLLEKFSIKTVALENMLLKEGPILDEILYYVNFSTTSLHLEDGGTLSYEFLSWLPNLCNLTIFMNSAAYKAALRDCQSSKYGTVSIGYCLRTYLLKAYHSELKVPSNFCVWEWYPQLNTLTGINEVRDGDLGELLDVKFVRECGNKALYGWQPNEREEDEEMVDSSLPGEKEKEEDNGSEISYTTSEESRSSWYVWDADEQKWVYDDLREGVQRENNLEEYWPKDKDDFSEEDDIWEDVEGSGEDMDSLQDEDVFGNGENDLVEDDG